MELHTYTLTHKVENWTVDVVFRNYRFLQVNPHCGFDALASPSMREWILNYIPIYEELFLIFVLCHPIFKHDLNEVEILTILDDIHTNVKWFVKHYCDPTALNRAKRRRRRKV